MGSAVSSRRHYGGSPLSTSSSAILGPSGRAGAEGTGSSSSRFADIKTNLVQRARRLRSLSCSPSSTPTRQGRDASRSPACSRNYNSIRHLVQVHSQQAPPAPSKAGQISNSLGLPSSGVSHSVGTKASYYMFGPQPLEPPLNLSSRLHGLSRHYEDAFSAPATSQRCPSGSPNSLAGQTTTTTRTTTTSAETAAVHYHPLYIRTVGPVDPQHATEKRWPCEPQMESCHGQPTARKCYNPTSGCNERTAVLNEMTDLRRRLDECQASNCDIAGLCGLENLGNTCYMNCAIQCLAFTRPIYKPVRQNSGFLSIAGRSKSGAETSDRVIHELIKLLGELWKPRKISKKAWSGYYNGVQPIALKKQLDNVLPQFKGYDQHDAQEFLAALLDIIFENAKRPPTGAGLNVKPSSPSVDIDSKIVSERGEQALWREAWDRYRSQFHTPLVQSLQGFVMTKIQCCYCKELSLKFEPTTILSVPIVDPETGAPISTLKEALNQYFKPEILSGGNRWNCPRCKGLRTAEKTSEFKRYPKILIVHLKRFTFDGRFRKLSNCVSVDKQVVEESCGDGSTTASSSRRVVFVENLGNKASYKLYAVINHTGRYTDGHYSAYCLHPEYRDWFQFDDDYVRRISDPEKEVIGEASYVLFFRQRSKPVAATTSVASAAAAAALYGKVMNALQLAPGEGAEAHYLSSGIDESGETLFADDVKKTDNSTGRRVGAGVTTIHPLNPSTCVPTEFKFVRTRRASSPSASLSSSSSSRRRKSIPNNKDQIPIYLSIGGGGGRPS